MTQDQYMKEYVDALNTLHNSVTGAFERLERDVTSLAVHYLRLLPDNRFAFSGPVTVYFTEAMLDDDGEVYVKYGGRGNKWTELVEFPVEVRIDALEQMHKAFLEMEASDK